MTTSPSAAARPRITALWPRLLTAMIAYIFASSFGAALVLSVMFVLRHPPQLDAGGKPNLTRPDAAAVEAILGEPAARIAIVAAQAACALAITLLATVLLDRRPFRTLGLGGDRRRSGTLGWGLILGVALGAVVVLAVGAVGGRRLRWEAFAGMPALAVAGLGLLVMIATFAEEWLYRGYVYANVREQGSVARAIFVSALIFSALHIDSPGGGFSSWANLFLLGVVLAQLREITGGIEASIGVHLGWNLSIGMLLGAGVSGFRIPSLLRISLSDLPLPLGGGEFGPEASLTATLALMVAAFVLGRRFLPAPEA